MPGPTANRGVWADLTGASERWLRTFVYAVLLGRLATVAVAVLIGTLLPKATTAGFSGTVISPDAVFYVTALVASPLLESLLVWLGVWFFGKKLQWSGWLTALAVAVAFVPFHGLSVFSLAIGPVFALMAIIQFNWSGRGRGGAGFWLIAAIHFAFNALALVFTAIKAAYG